MAPYIELEKAPWGEFNTRFLNPGNEVSGTVGGKPTTVRVVDDYHASHVKEVSLSVKNAGEGAVVFDRNRRFFGRQHGVVFIEQDEVLKLIDLRLNLVPGAYLDSLESLWRRMRVQAGELERNKWTVERLASAILSAGRTEDFTNGY